NDDCCHTVHDQDIHYQIMNRSHESELTSRVLKGSKIVGQRVPTWPSFAVIGSSSVRSRAACLTTTRGQLRKPLEAQNGWPAASRYVWART
ncbi:hypothetical protein AB0J35_62825, partial [Nonomuraea angiospora]|uniref:hypothetical protein n=1 Tax=Nonomuraea angiospora TaxID=46172 RepID=UPI003441470F